MSLILDALNKSDRDARNLSARPDLTPNRAQPERLARTRNLLLAVIALLITVAVALLAIIVVRHDNEPEPASQPMPVAVPPAIASGAPGPALFSSSSTPTPTAPAPAPADDPEVSALYRAEVSEQTIELPPPEIVTPATTVSPEDEALARYLWERSAPQPLTETIAPSEPAPPKTVKSTPDQAQPVAVEDSVRGLADVAFLHKLPLTVQNRIPTLMYAEHNYGEGFVVINKQTLNVGDTAADGVVVERIMADGTVFSFGNERFKLQAQSSWVNY